MDIFSRRNTFCPSSRRIYRNNKIPGTVFPEESGLMTAIKEDLE
jgi:hypothetical protein